jgi:phosphoglycerate dehydrogenase-like enzyme
MEPVRILKAAPGLDSNGVLEQVLGPGFDVIALDPDVPLIEQVADVQVLLLRDVPIPARVMDAAPGLKLLQRYGQHVSGVDLRHAQLRGIPVARVPPEVTGADQAVAEHAFFLILALAKRYGEAARSMASGKLGLPRAHGLAGKTLGLVGVGRTGKPLARFARAFGMRVIAVKRTPDADLEAELGLDFLGDSSRLDDLLAQSDYMSLHLAQTPETLGYFGAREFALMKRGACFINIARGRLVDQQALLDALTSGHLAGAGLDVFWDEPIDPRDPLLALANVIATPHIAAPTHDTELKSAGVVAENIRRVMGGQPPLHQVSAEEEEGN